MTEKISEWTPGKFRKMRKADQMRWNAEMKCWEVYQIDVPAELEDWEKEGLAKQAEMRNRRAKKKNEGKMEDERNSDLSD